MAIPFHLPSAHDGEVVSTEFVRIEQMLQEMSARMGNPNQNPSDIRVPYHPVTPGTLNFAPAQNNARPQVQQNIPPIVFNPVMPQNGRRHPFMPQRAAQPDLITACANELAKGTVPKTVVLKVQLCAACYNNGRKLKVIGVRKVMEMPTADYTRDVGLQNNINENGATFIANIPFIRRAAQETIVGKTMKLFKWPTMSSLKLSTIDTAIVAAAVVIIGWKIFKKQ